eukprot:gene8883-10928_t
MGRALIAVHGKAGLVEFHTLALSDPAVSAFRDKVSMTLDREVDDAYPQRWLGRVTVTTEDGRTLHGAIDEPKGDPGNSLSRAELADKFQRLSQFSGARTPAEADAALARMAAKVDAADKIYFETKIKPLIDGNPLIEFIGEIGDHQKSEFLGGAEALLFPIDWPEPFGLVMIEAMACGTPVVAFRCGSTTEVIEDGATGFLVDTLEEAVAAAGRATMLDREAVRA